MKFKQTIKLNLLSSLLLSFLPATAFAQLADYQTHTVIDGDTLWAISRKYYGDPLKYPVLFEYNPNISDTHKLRRGQIIYLGRGGVLSGIVPDKPARKKVRPFTWKKEYDPLTWKYRITISESDNNLEPFFFLTDFPAENLDYELIEYARNHPNSPTNNPATLFFNDRTYSRCDGGADTQFHEMEMYRLLRSQDPEILSQTQIGDVSFKDMNFDGFEDLVINKGKYGVLDIEFSDIYFWDENKQNFVKPQTPSLISAGNVVLNPDEKSITYTKQICLSDWSYYKYKLNSENKWVLDTRMDERCIRNVGFQEGLTMSDAEFNMRQFFCGYYIRKDEYVTQFDMGKAGGLMFDDDSVRMEYDSLAVEWKNYIRGENHPKIMKDKLEDYIKVYRRNHRHVFNSEDELNRWKKDNNVQEVDIKAFLP